MTIGCSPAEIKRHRLQGTVEFDGKPVPFGTIYFDPDTTKANKGPQGFAKIVEGKFDTDQGGKGHVGGPMKVRIVGYASAPSTTDVDAPVEALFPDFVEAVELEKAEDTRGFLIPKEYQTPPDTPVRNANDP